MTHADTAPLSKGEFKTLMREFADEFRAWSEDMHTATKHELRQDIADLRTELRQEILDLRDELKSDIIAAKVSTDRVLQDQQGRIAKLEGTDRKKLN